MPMSHAHRRLLTAACAGLVVLAGSGTVLRAEDGKRLPHATASAARPAPAAIDRADLADIERAFGMVGEVGAFFARLAEDEANPAAAKAWTLLARNYIDLGQGLAALSAEGKIYIGDPVARRPIARPRGAIAIETAEQESWRPEVGDWAAAGRLSRVLVAELTQFRHFEDWEWFTEHLRRAGFAERLGQDEHGFASALSLRDPNRLGRLFVQFWYVEDRYLWTALRASRAERRGPRRQWQARKFRVASEMFDFLATAGREVDDAWHRLLETEWQDYRIDVARFTAERGRSTAVLSPRIVGRPDGRATAALRIAPAPQGPDALGTTAQAPANGQPDPNGGVPGRGAVVATDERLDNLVAVLVDLQAKQARLVATIKSQQEQLDRLAPARLAAARPAAARPAGARTAAETRDPGPSPPLVTAAEREQLRGDVALLLDEIESERRRTDAFAAGVSRLKTRSPEADELASVQLPLDDGVLATLRSAVAKIGGGPHTASWWDGGLGSLGWRRVLLVLAAAVAVVGVIAAVLRALRRRRPDRTRVPDFQELLAIAGPPPDAHDAAAEEDGSLAPQFLGRVIRQFSLFERRQWAESLAGKRAAPRDLVTALANDEIEVARALLLNSEVLRDAELIDIVRHRSDEHRVHVALRRPVSGTVADALVATGNRRVITTLLENAEARISDAAMERIVDESRTVAGYREPIIGRDDLDPRLAHRLRDWVTGVLRDRIMERFGVPVADEDRGKTPAAMAPPIPDLGPESVDAYAADTVGADNGPITPQLIVEALRQGRVALFERLFGELTGLETSRLKRVIYECGGEDLAIACRALKLEKLVFASIFILSRKLGLGGKPADASALSRVLTRFEETSEQAAARTLLAWRGGGGASLAQSQLS